MLLGTMVWFLFFNVVSSSIMSNLKQKANQNIETKLLYLNILVWDDKKQDFVYLFHGLNTSEFARVNQYRYALYNESINIAAIKIPPYIMFDNETESWLGLVGDIWQLAEEYLHFRSNITLEDIDVATYRLMNDEISLILGAGIASNDYFNVEFSQPYYYYNTYYLYMRLPESAGNPLFIIRTLKSYLWAATFLMLLLIGICFWATTHVLGNLKLEQFKKISPLTCILMVHAGLLGQTIWFTPQRLSTRTYIFTSMLFGYTIYTTISALLVAELSVMDLQVPFTSIREVIEKQVSLCVRPNSWAHATLEKRAANIASMRKSINGPGCPARDNIGIVESICDRGVVFLESETVMVENMKEKWTCRVLVWGRDPRLPRLSNSLIFYKGFMQKRAIYHFLERLRSSGILAYLQDKWIPNLVRGLGRPKFSQVEFSHIRGILLMYFFLLMMSLLILLIECWVFKIKNRQLSDAILKTPQ